MNKSKKKCKNNWLEICKMFRNNKIELVTNRMMLSLNIQLNKIYNLI